jgi:N-acetylglutamate synthase-like GNAT family acetyltransferase
MNESEVCVSPVVLRPAVPSDAPGVSACVKAAYAPWVNRIGRKPWPMLQNYATVIISQQVIVAESDGQVIGVLVLADHENMLLLENVAVLPAWKGKGVGKSLLIRAEMEASAKGYDSIYLYTNEKMLENINLYTKIGYIEYERRQEEGFRRVFMRKRLS